MKKKLKLMLAVVLSLAMVMGSSLTAFSATVVMRNPNATGVQLIGDTLLIQEDHHNFFVWGKSLMIQCPGVTDVLPNNNTKLIDVQFNGNLYKGIEEVLIVKTQGKDDKIRLEEGSMIVTGITTPEQVQEVKNAIKNQPTNLIELKTALTNECVELGNTKNYIVGRNEVVNEGGAKVNPKSIEGTAELIGVDQTVQQTSSSTSEEKKSEPKKEEKKGEPSPTPKPTPTPKKCTHQYLVGDYNYIVCVKCGAANPECNGCTHDWNDHGYCHLCDHDCYHKYPSGITGAPCSVCGYNGSLPPTPTCQVDHSQYCIGWTCECGEKGTRAHFLMDDDTGRKHHCLCCDLCTADHTWEDGVCTVCTYCCDHNGQATGTCDICGKALSTTICAHTSGYDLISETQHECKYCHEKFSHEWNDGYCTKCGPCPTCSGNGKPGAACETCGKTGSPVSCPDEANHPLVHQGMPCLTCMTYVGTAPHTWVQDTEMPNRHGCTCGTYEPHHWTNKTGYCDECNAPCPSCSGAGTSGGCGNCGKVSGCSLAAGHSAIHRDKFCPECEYPGTASHIWIDAHDGTHSCSCGCCEEHNWTNKTGRCDECNSPCPVCCGNGAIGGCEACGCES